MRCSAFSEAVFNKTGHAPEEEQGNVVSCSSRLGGITEPSGQDAHLGINLCGGKTAPEG